MMIPCLPRLALKSPPALLLLALACFCFVPVSGDDEALRQQFKSADANHDGVLQQEEYVQYVRDHPASLLARSWTGEGDTFIPSFVNALVMIIATELGDKTFFVAAIMAMKHPRAVVFGASMAALGLMHFLSVGIGYALPALLPRSYTHWAAVALFAWFGVKLLLESRHASTGVSDELEEAEEELGLSSDREDTQLLEGAGASAEAPHGDTRGYKRSARGDLEMGSGAAAAAVDDAAGKAKGSQAVLAVAWQVASICFLAEWGDRSQIATIALAAAKNPWGIAFGGFLGHALCTGLAVLGGRLLASRISERTVTIVGGVLFLAFAVHGLFTAPGRAPELAANAAASTAGQ